MAIKLQCAATGDLVLVHDLAQALLGLLDKSPQGAGILTPAEMPAALSALRQLPTQAGSASASPVPPDTPADAGVPDADVPDAPVPFADEAVAMGKRAWPLIQMIERAQAAGKPIVWGV